MAKQLFKIELDEIATGIPSFFCQGKHPFTVNHFIQAQKSCDIKKAIEKEERQ